MLNVILVVGAVFGALQAIRARQLIASALWLAGVSALVAILLYQMGAREVAVIELSVGAGLVTVLFVFAIAMAGEEAVSGKAVVPRPLAWSLVIVAALLLGLMALPTAGVRAPAQEPSFSEVLWQQRGLDVVLQVVMLFAGAIGMLGLLSEPQAPATGEAERSNERSNDFSRSAAVRPASQAQADIVPEKPVEVEEVP